MLFAGFEIDADEFLRTRDKALRFGIASLALPFVPGAGAAPALGYGANAAALVGSISASPTLLGLPVVKEAGARLDSHRHFDRRRPCTAAPTLPCGFRRP